MYRKHLTGLAVAAMMVLGAGVPVFAQAAPSETFDPTEVLPSLDAASVAPALAVVTSQSRIQMDDTGDPFISAVASNGLQFEVRFSSCEEPMAQACKAMFLLAIWDDISGTQQAELRALVNDFQMENPIISTGFLPDGKPYVLRFVIADYGIQQGNVLSEFSNFIQNATEFHNRITSAGSEPSQP